MSIIQVLSCIVFVCSCDDIVFVCLGRVESTLGESLFWYPDDKNTADYNEKDFIPIMSLNEFSASDQQNALESCSGNVACQFDALVTGNLQLGLASKQIDDNNEIRKLEIGTIIIYSILHLYVRLSLHKLLLG